MEMISYILISFGLFFMGISALGLIRLPDFFTRTHAVSKTETLGISLVLIGLIFESGISIVSLKIFLVVAFVFIANPIASHLLSRSAIKNGTIPWHTTTESSSKDSPE